MQPLSSYRVTKNWQLTNLESIFIIFHKKILFSFGVENESFKNIRKKSILLIRVIFPTLGIPLWLARYWPGMAIGQICLAHLFVMGSIFNRDYIIKIRDIDWYNHCIWKCTLIQRVFSKILFDLILIYVIFRNHTNYSHVLQLEKK